MSRLGVWTSERGWRLTKLDSVSSTQFGQCTSSCTGVRMCGVEEAKEGSREKLFEL